MKIDVNISMNLPEVLVNQLDSIAESTNRPTSSHVVEALENYLNYHNYVQLHTSPRIQDKNRKKDCL